MFNEKNRPINGTMDRYAQAVAELATNKKSNLMHNEGNEHALIIFSNIFKTAEKYVKIVAKDLLNYEVANRCDYIDSLKGFLSRKGTRLEILLSNFDRTAARQTPLFSMLAESAAYKENRISIKSLGGRTFHTKEGDEIHFCIADDRMFRLETDVKARKALCNFNDVDQVRELNDKYAVADSAPTTMTVNL